jgi:hypothetical protein
MYRRLLLVVSVLALFAVPSAFAQSNCRYNVGANDGCGYITVYHPNGSGWSGWSVNLCAGANNVCSSPTTVNTDSSGTVYFQPGVGTYTVWPKNSNCYANWTVQYNELDYFGFQWTGNGGVWAPGPNGTSPSTIKVTYSSACE